MPYSCKNIRKVVFDNAKILILKLITTTLTICGHTNKLYLIMQRY